MWICGSSGWGFDNVTVSRFMNAATLKHQKIATAEFGLQQISQSSFQATQFKEQCNGVFAKLGGLWNKYCEAKDWLRCPGGGGNLSLGMTGTCRPPYHFRGRPIFKDLCSMSIQPFLWIFGRQSLLNIPEIQFYFTSNAQHVGKVATCNQPRC